MIVKYQHASVKKLTTFRFGYKCKIDYEYSFSISVSRLCIITSQTNLFPGYSFSTDKQHEGALKGFGKVTSVKF